MTQIDNMTFVETKCKSSGYWSTGLRGEVCTTCKIIFGPPGPAGKPGESGEEGLTGKDTNKPQRDKNKLQKKLSLTSFRRRDKDIKTKFGYVSCFSGPLGLPGPKGSKGFQGIRGPPGAQVSFEGHALKAYFGGPKL